MNSEKIEKPVTWGVLGSSHFALMAAIPAMHKAPLVDVRAVASRSLYKAKDFAEKASVPVAYGSYEELLEDPEIEAVYIPTPIHLHVSWSIKAARAGKHVLCEKPISLTAAEAQELADAQQETGMLISEGFMVRYHPQWIKVAELIQAGRIGEVRAVQSAFSYNNTDMNDIRNQKDAGGGALYDIGCYCINIARLAFGSEPKSAVSICDWDPSSKCDRLTSTILNFEGGHASFVVGTQHVPYQRVHIFGSLGHIEVDIPFNAPSNRPCKIHVDDGFVGGPDFTVTENSEDRRETMTLPQVNHYTEQWQSFSQAIRSGTPFQNDMTNAVANMRAIDAVFRSAESLKWEAV